MIQQETDCDFAIHQISLWQKDVIMQTQTITNFNRIKDAILYLDSNYKQQPSLEDVAEYVHLSTSHFQRLFTDWAGVSPKQFLQYITVSHAKALLKRGKESLLHSSVALGLSSTSRLHELFVKVEAMTPGEYKNGGANLKLSYSIDDTPLGTVLIASTSKGICHLSFIDDCSSALSALQHEYPNALITEETNALHLQALSVLRGQHGGSFHLHLRGTDFQLKVWEALLKIPFGELVTYGDLAELIGNPRASRAVGTAIGCNPVAYLVPCHRVIQGTGAFGGYKWGLAQKKVIVGWESAYSKR